MGSEMSCPCGRKQPIEELTPYKYEERITPQATASTSSSFSEEIKFKSDFEFQNSRLIIFLIDDIERFFRSPKNFIIKSSTENPIPDTKLYNHVYTTNYMSDPNYFITLLHYQDVDSSTPREKNSIRIKDFYRVDDLLLVSYDTAKTVELIEINLKNNLKKDCILVGFISNFKDSNRHHKIIYKKSPVMSKQIVYEIVILNKEINENNMQRLLDNHSDKILKSIICDFQDENHLKRKYYFVFEKSLKCIKEYDYLVIEMKQNFSPDPIFFKDLTKKLSSLQTQYKLSTILSENDSLFIILRDDIKLVTPDEF